MKTEKNTQKAVSHFKLTVPVVCPSCGGRMQRCYDNRRKASTWWCCPECKTTVSITDEDLQNGITERLNEVIADPERIEIPESAYEESQEVKRMSAEIVKTLDTIGFDKEALKQKMLTCVSEKYKCLGTEVTTAQSLYFERRCLYALFQNKQGLCHLRLLDRKPKSGEFRKLFGADHQ